MIQGHKHTRLDSNQRQSKQHRGFLNLHKLKTNTIYKIQYQVHGQFREVGNFCGRWGSVAQFGKRKPQRIQTLVGVQSDLK